MFRVKICGITNTADARAAAKAGADAVGLNFYPNSPRYITADQARSIVTELPGEVIKVGLFVNATADEACRTFDSLPLDLIQLHGDEPPEFLQRLGTRPVMRAFRVGTRGLEPVVAYLEACRQLGCLPRLTLIDAQVAGAYGGTGQTADWRAIETYGSTGHGGSLPPLVLAGGLTPGNVAEAIRTVRPAAVDTASGVESRPGKKDPNAIAEFVRAAHDAFADL